LTPISFVGWGFSLDPLGELTAPPGPLAIFRGPTSKGGGKGRKGEGEENGGREFVLCPGKKKKSRHLYGTRTAVCELSQNSASVHVL